MRVIKLLIELLLQLILRLLLLLLLLPLSLLVLFCILRFLAVQKFLFHGFLLIFRKHAPVNFLFFLFFVHLKLLLVVWLGLFLFLFRLNGGLSCIRITIFLLISFGLDLDGGLSITIGYLQVPMAFLKLILQVAPIVTSVGPATMDNNCF